MRKGLSEVDKAFLLKKFSLCVPVSQSVISISKLLTSTSEQKVYYHLYSMKYFPKQFMYVCE